MSFEDRFERQLVGAAGGLFGTARRGAMRSRGSAVRRRTLVIALGALATAGIALAATQPWSPQLGNPTLEAAPPQRAASSPPADQLKILGVLRRPQSADDQSPATQQALRFMSATASHGIRVAYVRNLETVAPGRAAVLIPMERYRPPAGFHRSFAAVEDALCVFYPEARSDGGAKACWSTDDLRGGRAIGQLGNQVYGLAPDGVATVRVDFGGAGVADAAVHDNFFDVRAPDSASLSPQLSEPAAAQPTSVSWLDANGQPVAQSTAR